MAKGLYMSSQTTMLLMGGAEFALWTVFGFLFLAKRMYHRYPAMGAYLGLRIAAAPVLLYFYLGQTQHWFNGLGFQYYFFAYFGVYIASAVMLYFVCVEVFYSALSAFAGIQKLGTVAFRWAALISVIVSLSTISFTHLRVQLIADVSYRLMRSVSILELCLLGFLCISMNALRLSIRDMAFGIALGFGLLSASDFILSSFVSKNTRMTDPVQFVSEGLILATLGMWVAYCALPEPARAPVLMPANSILFRWNEIASALGHTGTQVAVQQPASGFFLTDVERAVEKVLTQNLNRRESET
ncbi:MAG: hypothetical protein ABSD44_02895 [Terracidiphilus sp.]